MFWKLLVACAGVSLAAAVVCGTLVYRWQEAELVEQVERRLRDAAQLLGGELGERVAEGGSEELQEKLRRMGQETGMRLTLITRSGRVLADSEKEDLSEVAEMENHRDRPEVARAMMRGEGRSQRVSGTFEETYRYFAKRIDLAGAPVGVVRTAVTIGSVEQLTAAKRRLVWSLAGIVVLVVSALMYWIVGRIIAPMAAITKAAEAIAQGDYQQRIYVSTQDEFGQLASTLNRMCQELDARMTQLSQSHQRQATVLGGMIEGVIAVDPRERVLFANAAAGRLFDFRPSLVEGRRLLEVVRSHALDEAVTAALATRQPQRFETTRETADKMSVAIQATPLPGDPCPGVVLVMHDTTELRRLESLRRDFVANVSHELKTPLTSIKAYAETLRNGALDDREASVMFIERIQEQADRLHHLILDMLTLARIESEQQIFEIESVSIEEAVEACFESYGPAAAAKRIELVAEPERPACLVRADAEGLREILDNLVDNAIKYTPAQGRITVRWRAGESKSAQANAPRKMATVEVTDTGIGISGEGLARLFERFYRVDKARSRELGGTGLGLAIVKHLAQSFGGSVSVSSEVGRGSTFRVELPLA